MNSEVQQLLKRAELQQRGWEGNLQEGESARSTSGQQLRQISKGISMKQGL